MKTVNNPTMYDVAKLANVSLGTVSAAFNNKPVREKTKQKILEAANKLGYRPNLIARSMAMQKTNMLGLLLPWSNVELTDSAASITDENNYSLLVSFSGNTKGGERKCVEKLIQRRVDGIIFMPMQKQNEDYSKIFSLLHNANIKVVVIDKYFKEIKIDSVVTDNAAGGRLATEFLIQSGHRNIAFIAYELFVSSVGDRFEGYRSAMNNSGIPINDKHIMIVEKSAKNIKDKIKKFLQDFKEVSAIFAAGSDHLAYDVMLACRELGRKIPNDISVIGFDDMLLGTHRIADILDPPLTSVRQSFSEMTKLAINLLIDKIENNIPDKGQIKYIAPELIIRKSVKRLEN